MHRSYYAIIPANVRYDKRLTPNAKLLYGEITALCHEKGYCWATNSYFAELYEVSKKSVSKWINQLIEYGYIASKVKYKEGTKEIEGRYLTIVVPQPMEEKFHTYGTKVQEPMEEKFNTPMEEKVKENITFINNTFNNSTTNTADRSQEIFQAVQENIRYNLSPIEIETIEYWIKDYPHDLILEAIRRAVLSNRATLRYIETILKDWQHKRITNLAEVERDDAEFKQKRGVNSERSQRSHEHSSRSAEDDFSL
ncbi:DnaD domain protein [Ureibacillus suwonensis]|uniref:DnaD domain protein n=1 Tax=Ureibacillus suwonensis TaxID=313007 RepID=A0ABW0RBR4_9BACL